jgi:membrane protease YdiL (CAAX protease family)
MRSAPLAPAQPDRGPRAFLRTRVGVAVQIALVAVPLVVMSSAAILTPILMAALALALVWLSGPGLAALGFTWPRTPPARWVIEGLVVGVLWAIVVFGILVPSLQRVVPPTSAPVSRAGDQAFYFASYFISWFVNALCKGLAFRAFLLHRLETLFDGAPLRGALTIVVSAALFGMAHWHQGLTGVLITAATGAVLNLLFYWSRRNLWPTVLAHGVYSTTGFTLDFLGHL